MELLNHGLLTIFSFVFLISLVVVIHELGHYWAGRFCNVHAETFSLGFGPTLFSWRDKLGTVWRIAAFPLGGYVKFLGDAGAASEPDANKLAELREQMGPDADKCYHFKPIWQRAFITAAGPIANFILAVVIFTSVAIMSGGPYYKLPIVGSVVENSAAEEAGFMVGDRIESINGKDIATFQDIIAEVVWRPDELLIINVERNQSLFVIEAAARRTVVEDRFGGERALGQLGLGPEAGPALQNSLGPLEAIDYGMKRTWSTVSMTGQYVGRIITGRASPELLNGPLGIMEAAGQTAILSVESGETVWESIRNLILNLLTLAGFLSVGLGLVNFLPIPILDGGHLVYYGYEAVAGRPLSMEKQALGFRIGLALVLGMMLLATWNDLNYKIGQIF